MKPNSIARIEKEAEERLSHFTGEPDNYEGGDQFQYEGGDPDQYYGDNYIGQDDDLLSFEGSTSFMTEGGSAIQYSFTLVNAAAATKVIALHPTYLGTAAAIATATGETVDGVLTDGTIITSVTGTAANNKLTLDGLQKWVNYNPIRLIRMTVKSNSEDGFLASEVVTYELSPFRNGQGNRIPMTKFIAPDQYNAKKAVVDFREAGHYDFQLDNQRVILIRVGGTNIVATVGESLNITLEFGAAINGARSLSQKATRARKNMEKLALVSKVKRRC